jgi:1,4-dihydroxy-2-naphthoyl-CoA synthase
MRPRRRHPRDRADRNATGVLRGRHLAGGEQTFAAPGPGFTVAGIDVPAWTLSKPVIAAVNGHALGLGLTLALQCDIRFFAADARYGVVQVRRGVVGDAYSHWILPRLVGISNAAEILLSGATFDGHPAHRAARSD